jgi:hypothetical protein
MGLINREMASREGHNLLGSLGDPFWGNLSDWKCFGNRKDKF